MKKFDELKGDFDRGINVQTFIVVHDIKHDVHIMGQNVRNVEGNVLDIKQDVRQLGSTLDASTTSGEISSISVVSFHDRLLKH